MWYYHMCVITRISTFHFLIIKIIVGAVIAWPLYFQSVSGHTRVSHWNREAVSGSRNRFLRTGFWDVSNIYATQRLSGSVFETWSLTMHFLMGGSSPKPSHSSNSLFKYKWCLFLLHTRSRFENLVLLLEIPVCVHKELPDKIVYKGSETAGCCKNRALPFKAAFSSVFQ